MYEIDTAVYLTGLPKASQPMSVACYCWRGAAALGASQHPTGAQSPYSATISSITSNTLRPLS